MVNDVSKAYMHADCREHIFVKICEEDLGHEGERQLWGKLFKTMYGTQPAALDWQRVPQDIRLISFFSSVGAPALTFSSCRT